LIKWYGLIEPANNECYEKAGFTNITSGDSGALPGSDISTNGVACEGKIQTSLLNGWNQLHQL